MASAMINAKMTVETPDGLTYFFPKVELAVTANIDGYNEIRDGWMTYSAPSSVNSMKITGHAFRDREDGNGCIMTVTKEMMNVATCKVPELFPEDLDKIKQVMIALETMTEHIDGLFGIEIRVLIDDVDQWAVVGYGVTGMPALLRFENVE